MFASGRASSVKNLQKQTCGVACVGYFLWIRAARSSWLFNWLILCYISAINPPVHHSYNQQHFSNLNFPQLACWFFIECQQSCAPPDAAGQQRRQRHHHQLDGFGLRADYWGEGYYCFFLLALGLYSLCFPNQTSVETFSSSWLDTQRESRVVFCNNRRCYVGAFSFLITEKIWKDKSPSSLVCLLFLQVSATHLVLDALHLLSLTNLIRKYCAWVVQSI